jgi:dephospho-CoA kinase
MVVAVTGEIGAGKTTLAQLFEEWGGELISGDEIGWELLKPDEPTYEEIVRRYGKEILDNGREISREKLGKRVFSSPQELQWFNGLMHPELLLRLRARIEEAKRRSEVVVVDAALIVEWRMESDFEKLVVVVADEDVRVKRMKARGVLDDQDVRDRMAAQLPRSEKIENADWVIDNSGTMDELRAEAEKIWREIREAIGRRS